MQKTSKNKVNSIKHYNCGYCVNHMKYIVKKPSVKKRNFYAGVFLIKHKKYGNILYDTGYSKEIYNCGLVGKIYNLLNPTFIKECETIDEQLKKEKINPKDINFIILSHLHPDHIGCVKKFKNAKIIISRDCFNDYKKGKIRSLIFKKLLPNDFEERLSIIEEYKLRFKYFKGHDLFEDGSLILTQINGHSLGQIGLLIQEHNIFLGGDSAWGLEFLDKANEMSIFARFIQNNFNDYKKGFNLLKKLKCDGIKIYLSHDDCFEKELIK